MSVMAPVQTRVNGKPWWDNGYMLVPYAPPKPHEQRMTLLQPMRAATCEEVFCTWQALGHEGMDDGLPFKHPAGVRCGDYSRCLPCTSPEIATAATGVTRKKPCGQCPPCKAGTANCPCPARGRTHKLPNTPEYEDRFTDPVARATYRPQPIRHRYNVWQGRQVVSREVTGDEWKHRIAEGLEARNHILKRGI